MTTAPSAVDGGTADAAEPVAVVDGGAADTVYVLDGGAA